MFSCGCPKHGYVRRATGMHSLQRSLYTPKCALGRHSHPESRIVVTLEGAFETHYGRLSIGLNTARALFRNVGDAHVDAYSDVTSCLTVTLPPNEYANLATTKPFGADDEDFLALGRRLSVEMDLYDSASTLVLDCLCAELAARMARHAPNESRSAGWMERVRAWLEEEYSAPPSLQMIALAVDRDASYVAATFKKRFRKTIGDYVRELRVSHSLNLIADPQLTLVEIALRSGFSDQSHFARLFRKRFSLSPGEFRRRGTSHRQPKVAHVGRADRR
jgi:AraC-like DNA-binding protein